MQWTVHFLSADVQSELEVLPLDLRASFLRIVQLIEANGLEKVHEPYIKHLEGPLWEMRLRGRDGIARAAYVTAIGQRVVIVRVFTKKTQKTPRRESNWPSSGRRKSHDSQTHSGSRTGQGVAEGSRVQDCL